MSLFTLLEAARYLEYKSEASARGEEPHDYTTFTQLSAGGSPPAASGKQGSISQSNNLNNKNSTNSNNIANGFANSHPANSTSANVNTGHIKHVNGTDGGLNATSALATGNVHQQQNHHSTQQQQQHQQPQQQQQQLLHLQQLSNTSSSGSSADSPPLPFTLTSTIGCAGASIGQTGVPTSTSSNASLTSAVGYRQRSGSAASRQRTDSLSSHDDSSRDPHNKQSRRSGGAGTREVHNKLEKNRRAHLKECFESLKKQLPNIQDDRKTSNLTILRSALRYIQNLKKKEREFEQQMEQLAREKISAQQRLATLRRDGSCVLPLHDNHNTHHLPQQSVASHQQQVNHQQVKSIPSLSTNTVTTMATKITTVSACDGREASIGVIANAQHPTGTGDRASDKLAANDLKRRGSVSPDNETTTTASECGNLSDYEGDEFETMSHPGGQRQPVHMSATANHSSTVISKRDREGHHQYNQHRLSGTKTATTITSSTALTSTEAATITAVPSSMTDTKVAADVLATTLSAGSSAFRGNRFGGANSVQQQQVATNGSNGGSKSRLEDQGSAGGSADVTTFNSINNNAHIKNRHINSHHKEIKIERRVQADHDIRDMDAKEECKPITISVTSGSVASVITTTPTVNPIYQQATAGMHKANRREFKDEKPSVVVTASGGQLSNGSAGNGSSVTTTSQAIAFVTTSSSVKAHTKSGDSTSEGGQSVEVSQVPATTVTMEPPRAIFTPGNQKTVLPTYLPNTGNLATLLHAANTVSYIKTAPSVNNNAGANSHGELTVNVSSAPMATVSSGSMVASVVPPTMVSSIASSIVPSMGQIPLMCKPGSVVRLAASGHLVQPLTLVQQIPATAANGINNGSGGSNGLAGKAGTTVTSQGTMSQSSSHGHATQPATQLFLAQSTTATQGGAFKPATMGGAVAAGQPVTSMATVITQGGSSQASHHPTQIVAGVAPIGKMQIGNATTTLSIKPVSQFPLISGQQFITTSSQSLKPVVVVSVPQTSTQ